MIKYKAIEAKNSKYPKWQWHWHKKFIITKKMMKFDTAAAAVVGVDDDNSDGDVMTW